LANRVVSPLLFRPFPLFLKRLTLSSSITAPPIQTQKARKRPANGPQGLTTARKLEALAAQRSTSSSSSDSPPPPQVDRAASPHQSESSPPTPAQAPNIPSPSTAQSGPSNPSVPSEGDASVEDDDDDFDLDDLLEGINPSSPVAASDKSDDSEAASLRRMLHEEDEEEEEDETEEALSLKAESRMDEGEDVSDDDGDIWIQAIEALDMEEDPSDLRTTFQSLPLDDSLPGLPAEPIPASVAELMNRQPRWVYFSNPKNTKEIFEAMILEASAETEIMAPPPIKVINQIE